MQGGQCIACLPPFEIFAKASRKGLSVPATRSEGSQLSLSSVHVCVSLLAVAGMYTGLIICSLSFLLWSNLCSLFPTASTVLSFCCSHCCFAICVFALGFEQLAVHAFSVFPRETTALLQSHVVPSFPKASTGCQRESYLLGPTWQRARGTFFL